MTIFDRPAVLVERNDMGVLDNQIPATPEEIKIYRQKLTERIEKNILQNLVENEKMIRNLMKLYKLEREDKNGYTRI